MPTQISMKLCDSMKAIQHNALKNDIDQCAVLSTSHGTLQCLTHTSNLFLLIYSLFNLFFI